MTITGKELISMGYEQGADLGAALAYVNEHGLETAHIDARFFSGNIDTSELPSAYKPAATVRGQMSKFGLTDVVDEIMPFGCIMAGDWERDAPWRLKAKAKYAAKAAAAAR